MTSLNERVREDSYEVKKASPEGDDEDGHGILGSTPEHLTFCIDGETTDPIYTRIKKKRDIVNGESPDENANTTLSSMAAKKYKQISFEKEEVG